MKEDMHIRVSDQEIVIMLKDSSICQCDLFPNGLLGEIREEFELTPDSPLFWFARIKSTIEFQGSGTKMMNELTRILDEKQAWIVNSVNPYGKRSYQSTIEWFKKFGFEDAEEEGCLVRRPRRKA